MISDRSHPAMNRDRTLSTRRRAAPTVAVLLLLLAVDMSSGIAAGHHEGDPVPDVSEPAAPGEDVETHPTVDYARADLQRLHEALVEELNARLSANTTDATANAPRYSSNVFYDSFETDGRVGGIGNWTALGGHWTPRAGAGQNATAGWTMANAEGTYGTMDALLVMPALDLSAYPMPLGQVPFLYKLHDQNTVAPSNSGDRGQTDDDARAAVNRTGDHVTLILDHRYDFFDRQDGGRVLIFTSPPEHASEGTVLFPRTGPSYARATAPGGYAYTGHAPWRTTSFDLTPWSGQRVWIGFHVKTDPRASDDASYFSSGFGTTGPYGWSIDSIQVLAPSHGVNLKVVGFDGPSLRLDSADPYGRAAPDSNVSIGAIVLNAGADAREARVRLASDVATGPGVEHRKVLRPGEVWTPRIDVRVPAESGRSFRVDARAWTVSSDGNRTLPDVTEDNIASATFVSSAIRKMDVDTSVSSIVVDDDAPMESTTSVSNRGNVEETLTIDVTTWHANGTEGEQRVVHAPWVTSLAPGETKTFTKPLPTELRGEHIVVVNVTSQDGRVVQDTARYYVHASPPLLFDAVDATDPQWATEKSGWQRSRADIPVPTDGWMWKYAGTTGGVLILTPDSVAAATSARYTDLEMTIRYMGVRNVGPAVVSIGYSSARPASVEEVERDVEPWRYVFPMAPRVESAAINIKYEQELSWRTLKVAVRPSASDGYIDMWAARGLEVRVWPKAVGGESFYLDELVLTAVPEGAASHNRVTLVRATGSEGEPSSDTPAATAFPAQPSDCQRAFNCWTRVQREAALVMTAHTNWTVSSPTVGGKPALWGYQTRVWNVRETDRLTTPVIPMGAAPDPVLTFEHEFFSPGYPGDSREDSIVTIPQIGFVELQYRRDDGLWSDFVRLVPDGGYPDPLGKDGAGVDRLGASRTQSFAPGDGYYAAGYCDDNAIGTVCHENGMFLLHRRANGDIVLSDPPRVPLIQKAAFRLAQQPGLNDVDLSNRDVRIGFHLSPKLAGTPEIESTSWWSIRDVKLSPLASYAVDGAVESVTLETAYDWKQLGIAPGSTVPVNITVRNRGLFSEEFEIDLGARRIGEPRGEPQSIQVGLLRPGESAYVVAPWEVPSDEGTYYALDAVVRPASGADEDPRNDALQLGADGSLLARTVIDLAARVEAFPARGRESLARYSPITLFNFGNADVRGATLTRTITRQSADGLTAVGAANWTISSTIVANGQPVPFQLLVAQPAPLTSDFFLVPGAPGSYDVDVRIMPPAPDAAPLNDRDRATFVARPGVYAADFDEHVDWTIGAAWSVVDGFRSLGSLLAGNATARSLPTDLDSTALPPRVNLAGQRNALVNLMARHDLERGYDGFRLEGSTDGRVWYPIPAETGIRAAAEDTETIAPLVGSNPLAREDFPAPVRAITGSSVALSSGLDGWIPYTFDLGAVEAFTETAIIRELRAPEAVGEPLAKQGTVYTSPSMILDPNDEAARWEIRNETEHRTAVAGDMRWSGYATPDSSRTLTATFSVPSLKNGTAVLTWWDWRPGTLNSSISGVAGERMVTMAHSYTGPSIGGPLQVLERRPDGWNHLAIELDRTKYVDGAAIVVIFKMKGIRATEPGVSESQFDLGWAVDELSFASHRMVNGSRQTIHHSAPGDEGSSVWTGWEKVDRIPVQPGGWSVVNDFGPDGTLMPLWKFATHAQQSNLDARLVTPVIDLATLGGGNVTMRLWHRHDLLYVDRYDIEDGTVPYDFLNAYQGGVVEVQRFNQSTLAWDSWRQIYNGTPPSSELRPRELTPLDGAPYGLTIPGSTDSFARYPRALDKLYQNGQLHYKHPLELDTAYAFSGATPGADFVLSEFDLSPFAGESIRLAFHAWAGAAPLDAAGNLSRHWTLGTAEILGRVLAVDDMQLRARVATDASVRAGGIAIDQFEVSTLPHDQSISLRVDPVPLATAQDSVVRISGNISNRATGAREMIAVGLRIRSLDPGRPLPEIVTLTSPMPIDAASPYAAVTGPFDLAGTNEDGDTKRFAFQVLAPEFPARYEIDLEVVDISIGAAGYAYSRAADDIPGRSAKQLKLDVHDHRGMVLRTWRVDPPALTAPGSVTVSGTAHVNGTLTFQGTLRAEWLDQEGTIAAGSESPIPELPPGSDWTWSLPMTRLSEVGNYTLRVRIFDAAGRNQGADASVRYRVGTTDVAFADSFENGIGRWTAGEGAAVVSGDAKDGNSSLRIDGGELPTELSLAQPVDLAGLGPGAVLSFWHRPALRPLGSVQVNLNGNAGTELLCTSTLYWANGTISTTWQRVDIPLPAKPCAHSSVTSWELSFGAFPRDGGSWSLDAVALHADPLQASPKKQVHVIEDGARKLYPIAVHNPGLAAREVLVGIDARNSTLAPGQLDWVAVTPSRLVLAPGESATVTVSVTTPSAAGAFAQILRLAVNVSDAAAPATPTVATIELDFKPRSRNDLVVDVAIDGEAAHHGVALEEAVGHDISAVFRNVGTQPNVPLDARIWIVDDATGNIVWQQAVRLEALAPRVKDADQIETFVWRPTFGVRGPHTLRVVVDPDRHHLDFDRSNDDVTIRLVVTPLVRPDLVVDDATPKVSDPSGRVLFEAYAGDLVRVEAVIQNAGLAPARDVVVRLVSGTIILKEELVAVLPAGGRHVIRATQIVPENATTYRVLTFTPDVELDPSNNERTLHVPVFAPELRLVPEGSEPLTVRPDGASRAVVVEVRNDGAYPLLLSLDAESAGSATPVEPSQVALAPGERRNVTTQISAGQRAPAGERHLVLRARSADLAVATRVTIPYEVVPVVGGLLSVREARGPPDAIRILVDVVNTGNVPIVPEIAFAGSGARLESMAEVLPLAPGGVATISVNASLPVHTPPGARAALLELKHDGARLASVNATLDVRQWERITATAIATKADADELTFDLSLRYDANAPRDGALAIVGLPAEVEARFSQPTLRLTPEGSTTTNILIRVPKGITPGLYEPRVLLLDPAEGAPQAIAKLDVDLRRADLRVRTFERAFGESLEQGSDVTYVVVVRNLGTRDTQNEPVSMYVDGVLVARELVDGLPPGGERSVRLRWTAAAGPHAVTIQAGAADARPFVDAIEVGETFVAAATRLTPAPGAALVVALAVAAFLVRRGGWGRRRE